MRGWKHWLLRAPDTEPQENPEHTLAIEAGSTEAPKEKTWELKLKKKLPPRCAYCKKFMGYDSGLHIYVNEDWRFHTKCFEIAVEESDGSEEKALRMWQATAEEENKS